MPSETQPSMSCLAEREATTPLAHILPPLTIRTQTHPDTKASFSLPKTKPVTELVSRNSPNHRGGHRWFRHPGATPKGHCRGHPAQSAALGWWSSWASVAPPAGSRRPNLGGYLTHPVPHRIDRAIPNRGF